MTSQPHTPTPAAGPAEEFPIGTRVEDIHYPEMTGVILEYGYSQYAIPDGVVVTVRWDGGTTISCLPKHLRPITTSAPTAQEGLPCYYSGHVYELAPEGQICSKCGRYEPDQSGFNTIRDQAPTAQEDEEANLIEYRHEIAERDAEAQLARADAALERFKAQEDEPNPLDDTRREYWAGQLGKEG